MLSAVLFHHINNKTMPDPNTENGLNKKSRGEGNTERKEQQSFMIFFSNGDSRLYWYVQCREKLRTRGDRAATSSAVS